MFKNIEQSGTVEEASFLQTVNEAVHFKISRLSSPENRSSELLILFRTGKDLETLVI